MTRDAKNIWSQLKAYFPESVITKEKDYLHHKIDLIPGSELGVVDFGLEKEFVIPINNLKNLPADPLVAICGAMDKLENEELGIFQVLIEPTRNPWGDSMLKSVSLGP